MRPINIIIKVVILLAPLYFLINGAYTNTTYLGRSKVYLSTEPFLYFMAMSFNIALVVGCIIWIMPKKHD